MLARFKLTSPFPPIISLQPQHYHEIADSFGPRQPAIPSILNSLRTLSVTTGVVPTLAPSPTPARHAVSASELSLFVSSTCRLFASSKKVKPFGIKRVQPLLQNTRVGGGSIMISSALGARSGSATILLARWWPTVPFPRASAKVSQGGVCGGPCEKNGVPLAGLEPGRPRKEFAGRDGRAEERWSAGCADCFAVRDGAGRLFGPALVSELRRGSANGIGCTGPVARVARNRNANGQQETNRQRPAPDRHRYLALRQRSHRHAGTASAASAHASPPLRTGAASRNRADCAASSFVPQHFGSARPHARQKRRACSGRASARPASSRCCVGPDLSPAGPRKEKISTSSRCAMEQQPVQRHDLRLQRIQLDQRQRAFRDFAPAVHAGFGLLHFAAVGPAQKFASIVRRRRFAQRRTRQRFHGI